MLVREWTISRPAPHIVRVEHWRVFSGKARILVDDEQIYFRRSKFYDTGFEHRFVLDGFPCIVRALYRTWHYEYELWIDGKLQ
jgi:mannose-6-phosphate isomerase-like protein (cupin superfamily)